MRSDNNLLDANSDTENETTKKLPGVRRRVVVQETKYAFAVMRLNDEKELIIHDPQEVMKTLLSVVISVVGAAGAGKSTLCTCVMNELLKTNNDYFAASNSTDGFTKGAWILNQQVKRGHVTPFDLMDLEGLDKICSHYLSIMSIVLSKALVICLSNVRSIMELRKLLESMEAGILLMKQKNIAFVKPILYIQTSDGPPEEYIQMGEDEFPRGEFVSYLQGEDSPFPFLKEFTVKTFVLPKWPNGSGMTNEYQIAVRELVKEWKLIPSGPNMAQRLAYASELLTALNSNRPEMILDLNRNFFRKDCLLEFERFNTSTRETTSTQYTGKMIEENICLRTFIGAPEVIVFADDFIAKMRMSPYYRADDPFYDHHLGSYNCEIQVRNIVGDIYQSQMNDFRRRMNDLGNILVGEMTIEFNNAITTKIQNFLNNLQNRADFVENIPNSILLEQRQRKEAHVRDLTTRTKSAFSIPNDFLSKNFQNIWSTKRNERLARLEAEKQGESDPLVKSLNGQFNSFACDLLDAHLRKFKAHETPIEALPPDVINQIETQKRALRQQFVSQMKGHVDPPSSLLAFNYTSHWNVLRNTHNTKFRNEMNRSGASLAQQFNEEYASKVKEAIKNELDGYSFNSHLPSCCSSWLESSFTGFRDELTSKFRQETHNVVPLPGGFLSFDHNCAWVTSTNSLRAKWDTMIAKAQWISQIRVVGFTDDFTCANCGKGHSDAGVGHRGCEGASWYWIEGTKSFGICNVCKEISTVTGVCCHNCQTSLPKVRVVPMK